MADNYVLQRQAAQRHFLRYDQEALIQKFRLRHDENYLYPDFFGGSYRLSRRSGDLERLEDGRWLDANSFGEVMTLLDLLCDSRPDRFLTGEFTSMENLGNHVHSNLLELTADPLAQAFDREPEGMGRACVAMGATPVPYGDLGFSFPVFDGLTVQLRFWHADEDFPASIRWFWDKNALMYLRYETTYFAIGYLRERLHSAAKCAKLPAGDENHGA